MARALVTNDDGVWSLGLRLLAESMSKRGFSVEVYAPLGNWSGSSKAIGSAGDKRAFKVSLGGVEGYAIDAPPAFCVSVALLSGKPYDVVVSGVNNGPNVGVHDILSSGTIGAALEASLRGVPGVAVSSYCGDSPKDYNRGCMGPAAEIASIVAQIAIEQRLSFDVVVINAPPPPWRGVVASFPVPGAPRVAAWVRGFTAHLEPKRHRELYLRAPRGSDGWALVNGFLSLTFIRVTRRSLEWVVEEPEVEAVVGEVERLAGELGYLEGGRRRG
jgi:5'-nucleotidase